MTESEKADFAAFCQQATDMQVDNIVEKEREFADTDPYRAACLHIAELEQARRAR